MFVSISIIPLSFSHINLSSNFLWFYLIKNSILKKRRPHLPNRLLSFLYIIFILMKNEKLFFTNYKHKGKYSYVYENYSHRYDFKKNIFLFIIMTFFSFQLKN